MKTQLLGIFILLYSGLFAQVADNFDDSDLLINPKWGGELQFFNSQNKQLHSNNNNANSLFNISTPCAVSVNSEWRIDVRLLFNTSSLNYIDLVVLSDSADVTKMKNGYFVRLGGTTDEVSLFKTKNGTEFKLIDGADNVLNNSNNQWTIVLKRHLNSLFSLERQSLVGGSFLLEGYAMDSDIISSSYFGIRIKQSTVSFIGKHFFDNLYIGKILKDTIPPDIDSLIVMNNKQLKCVFNEACESLSMSDISNYNILQGNIKPLSANAQNDKTVLLDFQNAFLSNVVLNLNVQNVADTSGNYILSATKQFYYSKSNIAAYRDLLITELMPDPNPVVGLPDKEYVEITNISGKYIELYGCSIHDPTGSKNLPNQVLAPDSILVLTNVPSLNNAADKIWLTNQNGEIIHVVDYTDDWYKDNNKKIGGWSLEMINLYNFCTGSGNWQASINPKGGTPGTVNSVKGLALPDNKAPLIISAVPLNDATLRIQFNEEIDSIHSQDAKLKVIGNGSFLKCIKIYPDNYGGEWQVNFIPNADSLYEFSFSGIRDCSGNELTNAHFKVQWPSNSQKNELIINEILFDPKTGGYDFIEFYNNSLKAFDLSKHFIAVLDETKQYKSIDKISTNSVLILPHQYLLLSADTLKVCEQYNCKNNEVLKINYSKMPSMPDDKGNLLLVNMGGIIIDSLTYSEDWHFPLLSDREGVSLERISFSTTSRTYDNWHSAASVAGFATPGYLNSQTSVTSPTHNYFSLQNKTVSPDEDGYEDILILNYHLPKQDYMTTMNIFDTEGRLIKQWINNETLGMEGFVTWNGTDYNMQKTGIGMYILAIECTHLDGSRIKENFSFTVAGRF